MPTSDNGQLRVLKTVPPGKEDLPPLLFIPGLGSIVPGWDKVLLGLKDQIPILYFESREKSSSKVPKKAFTADRFAQDLAEVVNYFELNGKPYLTVSSSLGATTITIALAKGLVHPTASLIIGPNPTFPVPRIVKPLIPLFPSFIIAGLKPVIRWYIHTFMIDMKNEPQQAKKYDRVLAEMDPWKIKQVALAFRYVNLWPLLSEITDRCIMVGASKDKMHLASNTIKFANLLKNAEYVDLDSNKATHDQPLIDLIIKTYNDLGYQV